MVISRTTWGNAKTNERFLAKLNEEFRDLVIFARSSSFGDRLLSLQPLEMDKYSRVIENVREIFEIAEFQRLKAAFRYKFAHGHHASPRMDQIMADTQAWSVSTSSCSDEVELGSHTGNLPSDSLFLLFPC